ncbi:penicillin-binding protein 1A [soil metagenome]
MPWFLRWPALMVGGFLVACLIGLVVLSLVYGSIARGFDLDELGKMPERSEVIDRNGVVLGRLHGENRTIVPLPEVSNAFLAAVLAREDNRFYNHNGVDYVGVVRAGVRNFKEREVVQGASTITMQLARNSYGIFEKTLHRKLTEIFVARRIERRLSKDEILEAYVNRIFYGTGLYGIELAAQAYFDKPAKALTLGESAMLAGIIRGPNKFSPYRNLEGAAGERDIVLARMVEVGRITQAQADAAKAEPLDIQERGRNSQEETYALDAVRRDLDLVLSDADVEDGGFKIYTTLDARLQDVAEASIDRRLREVEERSGYPHQTRAQYGALKAQASEDGLDPPGYLQGALLAIDNETGGIACVVGGRKFDESQFNRALLSQRQVGSTFKPFVYTAAFQAGLLPGTYISDNPIRPGELQTPGSGNWSPGNSDGKFLGNQTAETGLVRSRNTMSVRVGDLAGIDNVIALAETAGFPEIASRSPQVFIGNLGATLKHVTSAFSIFPNNGVRRRPYLIDRIVDRAGRIVYQSGQIEYPVIKPGLDAMVDRILKKVVDSGTAASARRLGYESPAGGKTGTTNDYHDAWFVGYSDRLTCGVWVGLDQPQRIISRGYGSTVSLPIWVDLMKHAEKIGYRLEAPKAQPALAQVNLCRVTGGLSTQGCANAGVAYQDDIPHDLVPQGYCQQHQGVRAPPPQAQRGSAPAPSGQQRKSLVDKIKGWFR